MNKWMTGKYKWTDRDLTLFRAISSSIAVLKFSSSSFSAEKFDCKI